MPSSKIFQKNCKATSIKENFRPCASVVVTSLAQRKSEIRVWIGAVRHISNTERCTWTSLFHIRSYKLSGILVFACLCFEGQSFSPSLLTHLARHQDCQEKEEQTKTTCHRDSEPGGRREFGTRVVWGEAPVTSQTTAPNSAKPGKLHSKKETKINGSYLVVLWDYRA